jgi:hypothetical protein
MKFYMVFRFDLERPSFLLKTTRQESKKLYLKKYTGLLGLHIGSWANASAATHLQIIQTHETKAMAVLSIARNETNVVQKLLLMMPHKRVILLWDTQEKLEPMAKEIAKNLELELKYPKL